MPEHDPTRGNNVIVTKAAPNRITKKSLDKAKRDFSAFMELPSPRAAVMIGGASQAYNFTHDTMVKLCLKLNHIEDASFMISTSRRSGAENLQTLFEHIDKDKHFIWDGLEPNPYLGMLAWADYIIVTADSTSMLSEACTTGKPVYMFPLNKRKDKSLGRIDKLHENLKQSGAVRIFDGQLENWDYTPFNDAAKIAKAIKKRMNL